MRWIAVSSLVALLGLALVTLAAAREKSVPGAAIAAKLREGRAVQLYDVTIRGELDLRSADVRGAFTCELCVFNGDIDASGAVFRQSFSLDRSRIKGSLYFHGARFESAISIGAEAHFVDVSTSVEGRADFSVASFASTANFTYLDVNDLADFTQATFHGRSVFNSSQLSPVFEATEFARDARFVAAQLDDATFSDTAFRGLADFRRAKFYGGVFNEADFAGGADFNGSLFLGLELFDQARFHHGANFKHAKFSDVSFVGVSSSESLSFDHATLPEEARFDDVDVAGTLSFEHVTVGGACPTPPCRRPAFTAENLDAEDLRMPLSLVKRTPRATQASLLRMIVTSAKARGDYGTANDAYYQLQIVRSSDYRWSARLLDMVFYRGFAGYLVRPEHPLVALLLLALIIAIVRVRRRTGQEKPRNPARRPLLALPATVSTVIGETLRRLSAAIPRRFGGNGQPLPRIEQITYRFLLICALVGLWANPALREFINLLR